MTRRPPERQHRLPLPDADALDALSESIDAADIVPAPYLHGAPTFPDDLLALMECGRLPDREAERMRRYRRVLKRKIRGRREDFEARIGKLIRSEPTWRP